MLRIADLLLTRYEKVIFATTTPVRDGNPYYDCEAIARYNEIIVPLLREKGVIINDLYTTVAADIDKYIRKDDKLHLTDEGIKVCAKQVADIIKKTAESLSGDKKKGANAPVNTASTMGAPV